MEPTNRRDTGPRNSHGYLMRLGGYLALLLVAFQSLSSTLIGCDFVTVPRCDDRPIPRGTIRGDWRGLPSEINCDYGYEYTGDKLYCYDFDHCSLIAFANKRCLGTMVYLPEAAVSKHPLKPKANGTVKPSARFGKGGAAKKMTTTSWSLGELHAWVETVNCTKVPDDGSKKGNEAKAARQRVKAAKEADDATRKAAKERENEAKVEDDGVAQEEKFDVGLQASKVASIARSHLNALDSSAVTACVFGSAILLVAVSVRRRRMDVGSHDADSDEDAEVALE